MIPGFKLPRVFLSLAGAALAGVVVQAAPAEAGYRHHGGYGDHVVVHRHVAHRPLVRRVVVVHRPALRRVAYGAPAYGYRPHRRVVVIDRPYHRVGYRGGWRHHRWHDRPRCFLPERYLCR